jgi:hypothetical protein
MSCAIAMLTASPVLRARSTRWKKRTRRSDVGGYRLLPQRGPPCLHIEGGKSAARFIGCDVSNSHAACDGGSKFSRRKSLTIMMGVLFGGMRRLAL